MPHDRIMPVNDGRDHLLIPEQKAAIPRTWIEHEAQAHIVALALHAIDPPSLTAKTHPAGVTHTDPIHGLIGSGCQRLRHGGIDVRSNPGAASAFGVFMQVVFRKVMVLAE